MMGKKKDPFSKEQLRVIIEIVAEEVQSVTLNSRNRLRQLEKEFKQSNCKHERREFKSSFKDSDISGTHPPGYFIIDQYEEICKDCGKQIFIGSELEWTKRKFEYEEKIYFVKAGELQNRIDALEEEEREPDG